MNIRNIVSTVVTLLLTLPLALMMIPLLLAQEELDASVLPEPLIPSQTQGTGFVMKINGFVIPYLAGIHLSYDAVEVGTTLRLLGNTWKYIDMPVTVTEDTVIELDFKSGIQGEIQGISLDDNNSLGKGEVFWFYGTQVWENGIELEDKYVSAPEYQHYVIPVGQHYTGEYNQLVFAMDDDAAAAGESVFSNVTIDGVAIDFNDMEIKSYHPSTQDLSGTALVETEEYRIPDGLEVTATETPEIMLTNFLKTSRIELVLGSEIYEFDAQLKLLERLHDMEVKLRVQFIAGSELQQ